MKSYWLTISIEANDYADAFARAVAIADSNGGSVVQVDQEPPQGALIVGDHHEDEL